MRPPETDNDEPHAITRQDVFAVLGALGAILSIVAAVMLYFGWRRSDVQAQEMGIDVSLFGLSAQDYVMRSISSLYAPLLVVPALVLGWSCLHAWVLRRLARARSADATRRWRLFVERVAIAATVVAVMTVLFVLATGWSVRPFPVDPIVRTLDDRQWIVPLILVFATLVAAYAWWLRVRLTPRANQFRQRPWQAALAGAVVTSTVALGGFWMLEEYASSVGRDYAQRIEAGVRRMPLAEVVSPTPLGIQAHGVDEEPVEMSGSTFYRTTGLRRLARSGGKVLLLPEDWSLGGTVVVVGDRDDLVWTFTH